MDVKLPNGRVIKGVPEGASKKDIARRAIQAGLASVDDFYPAPDNAAMAAEARRGVVERMGPLERFGAGIGQGMTDLAYGAGQALGLVGQDAVREKAARDSALMESGFGKAGAITGQIATAAPLAFVPGANTVAGAALTGAALGVATPVPEGNVLAGKALAGATGAAAGAVGHVAGRAIAGKISSKLAARETARLQNAGRDAVLRRGRELGYAVEPTLANPTLANRTAEGLAGKLATAQRIAEKNQAVTNSIARKAIGLSDDTPLDEAALDAVRAEAGKVYEAIRTLPGRVNTDARYQGALQNIAKPFRKLAEDVPEEVGDDIEKLVASYSKESFDPSNVIDLIRRRRKEATTLFKAYDDPVKQQMARAHRSIADALEDMLERHVRENGTPQLVQQLKEARQLIAKTYTIQGALNEGSGNVIAQRLGQQLSKGKPLSGELADVARFARAFPKSVQEVRSSMTGNSPLDWALAGGVSAGTGNPSFMAMLAARPAVRNLITSRAYQGAMVQPSYAPGIANRVLQRLGNSGAATIVPAALSIDAVQQ